MRAQGLTMAAATAAAAMAALLATATPVFAQGAGNPAGNPADVQWAQETLKSKGYDLGGRVSNRWTDGAKRALTAFQRANGLPATGELDGATMGKLSAARSASPSMGVLGAPSSPGSPTATRRNEAPPQPKAAPTSRVGSSGTGDAGVIGGVVLGHAPPPSAVAPAAPTARSPAAGHAAANHAAGAPPAVPVPRVVSEEAPSPTAAPRAQVIGADGAAAGGVLAADEGFKAANWMRYGVGGLLAAALAAMGIGWWRSGRPKAPGEYDDEGERLLRARLEPSFGKDDGPRGGLPPLTAPTRSRR